MKPRIVKAWTYNVKEAITRLTQDKGKHQYILNLQLSGSSTLSS
jgi:hypothetical protein